MRILQVGPIPPEVGGKTAGGVATHTWQPSYHLARIGHDVAILADNFSNSPEFPISKDGVIIYGTLISRLFILKRSPTVLLNLRAIDKLRKHFEGLHRN